MSESKNGPELKLLKFEINNDDIFDMYLERMNAVLYSDEGTEYADLLLCFLLDYFNEFENEEFHQMSHVQTKLEETIMWLREYNSLLEEE